MLTAFLRFAGGGPLRMLDRAMAMRRSDPALTADETSRLPSAVRPHPPTVPMGAKPRT